MLGNVAFGFRVLIAGAFHVVVVPSKIPAMVVASSFRAFTPERLYDTVTGDTIVGM